MLFSCLLSDIHLSFFLLFLSFVETQTEMGIRLSSEEEEISKRELEDPI